MLRMRWAGEFAEFGLLHGKFLHSAQSLLYSAPSH
jgi:hypothetical protein